MIFARFKGPLTDGVELTPGRIYIGCPGMDGDWAVGFGFIEVVDDSGKVVRFDPERGQFEFLDRVYAAVLKPFGVKLVAGDVVVLDDASDDGMFSVSMVGFRSAKELVVLDGTNLYPGVSVMDSLTGCWEKVRRVDERMRLLVDDQTDFRPPTEFRMAVAGGEVLIEPLVKCVDDDGAPALTKGKWYCIRKSLPDGSVTVETDCGSEQSYFASRFEMG